MNRIYLVQSYYTTDSVWTEEHKAEKRAKELNGAEPPENYVLESAIGRTWRVDTYVPNMKAGLKL